MAEKFISLRNIQFLLYEVFDSTALTKYPYFEDHGKETFDMVIETAMRMGKDLLYPCLSEMDKQPPEFIDGKIFAAPRSSDPGGEKLPLGDGLTVKMKQEWFE